MRKAWIVALVGALALVGCGGDGDESAEEDIPAPGATATTTAGGPESHDHGPGAGEQGCPAASTSLRIVASNTKFDTNCLAASANQPLTLSYENKDQISHGLVLLESHSSTEPFYRVDVFSGPKSQTLTIPAQKPGTYAFHCQNHPTQMSGTFVVK